MKTSSTTTHVAQSGDYLVKIAEEYGTTWQAIWNHPGNAEHRRKRGSPDILYPGDVLVIPVVAPGMPPPGSPPELQTPPRAKPPGEWPYPPPPEKPPAPTWACPAGLCVCNPEGAAVEPVLHTVFLHDDASRRMRNARCRVHVGGIVVAAPSHADASGALALELPPDTKNILIEWAPPGTPLLPTLPYRRWYNLVLGDDLVEAVRRRLDHIGVSHEATLDERISDFQEAYGLPVDGMVASVAGPLAAYHDAAMLPPLGEAALPPDPRPPKQGCVSAVADRAGNCHFSFRILAEDEAPIAGARFVLGVGDGRVFEGTTDGEGKLEYGNVEAGDYPLTMLDSRMNVPAIPKTEQYRPLVFRPESREASR